jgi:transcriptional regulator
MYVPETFKKDDPAKLIEFAQKNNFGILFSGMSGNLQASHLPFLIEPDPARPGYQVIFGHMAKANLQWQTIGPREEVLVVFQGPHAYISPTWYETPNTVPTWNYAVVHAYGNYQPINDGQETQRILKALVHLHEASFSEPWKMESLAPEFIEKMTVQIKAFKIEVTRLEGKWKLNQNHPEERRQKTVAALRKLGGEQNLNIANLMEKG